MGDPREGVDGYRRVVIDEGSHRRRFLVVHDYGMGGLWWWVRAGSAREILERIAEVEVVVDPEAVERAATWDLAEVDLDAPELPPGLQDLREQREAHRGQAGFGVLVGRPRVYLLRVAGADEDEEEPVSYYWEVGSDGRRLRQVEVRGDGPGVRSGPDDWPFNPPVVDLYEPLVAGWEIGSEEFEAQWRSAVPDDGW